MDLYAVIDQIASLLQQRGRLAYRALQLQFQLDEEHLAAVKAELLQHGLLRGSFVPPPLI